MSHPSVVSMTTNPSSLIFIKIAIHDLLAMGNRGDTAIGAACEAALVFVEANMRDANVVPKLEEYEAIFKPFMLAIQEKKNAAVLLSLELLAKLFEYGYWNMSVSGIQGETGVEGLLTASGLIGLVTETVANCFAGETTDEKIQMQVLRALAAAISVNDNLSCLHGSQLLKSVRVIYNIFLLSRSPGVQTIAQV
ncbi:guanine nucleotide exchange protein for ADP-robosylation factor [Kappamyces sp. JEL0680]|nr:guanine nucleotide exchange protein for ADP-robosylation factor [Kappamyces sp. JEL0680]